MAKPSHLANLRPWKPGQSGNPGGITRRVPEHLRGILSLTRTEVCKLVSKYARMSQQDIEKLLKDKKAPILDLSIASIFMRSFRSGDYQHLSFLLDQAIGKVPVTIENDEDRAAREELENLSDQELLRLVKEKIPELESQNK